jgi:hypothetical protein
MEIENPFLPSFFVRSLSFRLLGPYLRAITAGMGVRKALPRAIRQRPSKNQK